MAKKTKETSSLVEVLQPTATSAFDQANQAVEAIPSVRLPVQVRKREQQMVVVDMLRQVATANKVVEEKRRSVTTHLDAAKRALNKLFEPLKTHLTELRSDLESRLDEYREWQEGQAEAEREELRKKAEAQRRRAETIARKKLEEARSAQEARRIKQEATAKAEVAEAVLESRLDAIDDTPETEEGVAVIEDIEITDLDIGQVPEFMSADLDTPKLPLWTRLPMTTNIKKMLKAGVEVPGVKFERKTRRVVRSM